MPLHTKKHINHGIVALWHITESKEELIELLPESWLSNLELDKVSTHNLAARILAHTVCPQFDILEKDDYGKPYFESTEHNISITHAGKYAAFMFKETDDCGIDMEEITPRIERIVPKFVREDEQQYTAIGLKGMFMVWCAKEALYKYYGLKSLDFKEHLKVDFDEIKRTGTITGYISKGDYQKTLNLDYEYFDEYLLIHTY